LTVEQTLRAVISNKYGSLKSFAAKVNLPYTTIDSIFKRGFDKATVVNLNRICGELGISADALLKGEVRRVREETAVKAKTDFVNDLKRNEVILIYDYRQLNALGKDKASAYVADLARIGEYREGYRDGGCSAESPNQKTEYREMKVYNEPSAAGSGSELSDDDYNYEYLTYPAKEVPEKADFGVRISGDSMMPLIGDKSVVWVKAQETLENGQIGIFILNGDAYCKKIVYEAKQVILRSLNKVYKDIFLKEYDELKTVGKVLI
jgi:SOS-response transcriptional repressor LexA